MGYFKKICAFLVYAMYYHENVHNKINAVYIEHWVKENGLECGFVEHWLSSVYVNGPKISQMYRLNILFNTPWTTIGMWFNMIIYK